MKMVQNNKSYNLVSPTGDIREKVNARKLFNIIVKNNWESGEPGLLFQDNINVDNPMRETLGDITGCNPCFTGDMEILTKTGYRKFDDLPDSEPIELVNCHGNVTTGKIWNNGEKETIKLIFSQNEVKPITCTPEHVFLNSDYEKVEAKDLLGDRILPMLNNFTKYPQAQLNQIVIAKAKQNIINNNVEDCDLLDVRIALSSSVSFLSNSMSFPQIDNQPLVQKISNILAYHNIENDIAENNTTIDIMQYQSLVNYYLKIGFVKETLNKELKETIIRNSPMIVDIIPNGITNVYDFNEPESHWGAINGFIAHNCGEITMYEDEACCLGSINLSNFVHNKEIDWGELERVTRLATRFLDTAIDVNLYPDKIIEDKVKSLRRIGLGIMGLHYMLIKLGFAYDSENGRKVAENVMHFINGISFDESHQLAKEKGSFPLWEESSHTERIRNVSNTMIAPTGE